MNRRIRGKINSGEVGAYMTMGERIKQLRSANGFTQEMLAEKMNVSVRQL